jgi:hypothetical protein
MQFVPFSMADPQQRHQQRQPALNTLDFVGCAIFTSSEKIIAR